MKLILGTGDKTPALLEAAQPPFLVIDDGPIADAFLAAHPKAKLFDPTRHRFNPLQGIDHKRARDLATILFADFPQSTLTVQYGKRALARLATKADYLRKIHGSDKDPAEATALGVVDDVLFSPVLKRVFGHTPNFPLTGSIVAKLDRAKLGDFDAFILAALLIGQYQGQVFVPDFGFYGRELHIALIRQCRLVAGLNYLAEVSPKLQQALLSIKDKKPVQAVFDDADTLAKFAGWKPGDQGYSDFVRGAMQ